MSPISAVIITFNEEEHIARCIESLRKVADEILVVDSFSTDRTEEICRELGARFIRNPWQGYMEQKNFADSVALHDHILSVDADEALSEELSDSILKLKREGMACDGYFMNRMTCYCGTWIRHGSWYPDRKLRLFNRTKGAWGGGAIHESVKLDSQACTGFLRGDLLHYSYSSVDGHVRQANHFSSLSAEEAFANGQRSGWGRILLSPLFRFLRDYIIRLGFLDGFYGYVVCRISAHATFLKYVKLRELYLKSRPARP